MRLIDAERARKEISKSNDAHAESSRERALLFRNIIILDEQPTVYSVTAIHAHWEYDPNGMDWNMGAWRCSKCKERNNNIGGDEKINPLLFTGSSYCPSCGAKMDEKSTEERANEM